MNENNDLMERMMTRKAEARQQMEKKEGEVRFLQNELDRMRAERGEQDFENLRRASVDNGKDNNSNNNNTPLAADTTPTARSNRTFLGRSARNLARKRQLINTNGGGNARGQSFNKRRRKF
mmetsp:Transcript_8652/g.18805  ORF Transcript_8652/g.18805 Transcript_8652/m.18805 type:complete len:121 (-) Transcript_8652:178-540(-)